MIKTIIFDFNQTIYVGDVGDNNKIHDKTVVDMALGEGTYDKLSTKYHFEDKDIKDIVDIFRRDGFDYQMVSKLFSEYLFIHKIKDKLEVLPNKFFKELSERYSLYIVSMSQLNYLEYYFEKYNIDTTCFKGLLCLDLINNNSKGDLYNKIIKKIGAGNKPNEILIIGDNFKHDIKPALDLGLQTLHFKTGNFNEVYDYLTINNILDCTKFKNIKKFIYSD